MNRFSSRVGLLFVVAAAMIFLRVPAFAQVERGNSELLISGNMYLTLPGEGSSSGSASTQIFYGYFLSRNLQIGGGPNITVSFSNDTKVVMDANLFMRLYFQRAGAKSAFYIGARGYLSDLFDAYNWNGDLFDKLYLNPHIGMKFYFTRKAAFDINAGYGFAVSEIGGGIIVGSFGISFIL